MISLIPFQLYREFCRTYFKHWEEQLGSDHAMAIQAHIDLAMCFTLRGMHEPATKILRKLLVGNRQVRIIPSCDLSCYVTDKLLEVHINAMNIMFSRLFMTRTMNST